MFRAVLHQGLRTRTAPLALATVLGLGALAAHPSAAQDAGQAPRLAQADKPDQQTQAEQQGEQAQTQLAADPAAVEVRDGYEVEVFAEGLSYPVDIAFGPNGEAYVAETGGHTYGTKPDKAPSPRIVQIMPDGSTEVLYDKTVPMEEVKNAPVQATGLPDGLISPVTGLTWHDGKLYVSYRTRISTLDPQTGEFNTIVEGIPSWGEFQNNKPVFGPDGKMYFVNSTQGNSGPVDGHMIEVMKAFDKPDAREAPCEDVTLTGQNYELDNKLTEEEGDKIAAAVYVPLGQTTEEGQVIEGQTWCHGAVYRADPDGGNLEVFAWGLRSNFGYDFSPDGRLFATQNSGNIMEPRPIYNDWEPVYEIEEGAWYGWPDFYSSIPVTDPRFGEPHFTREEVPEKAQPFEHEFALTEETRRRLLGDRAAPPAPVAYLPVHSAAEGMVFGREEFGIPENEIVVAEFGAIIPYYKEPDEWPGFRVQTLDLQTGEARDLLVNQEKKPAWETGSGGLRRPLQVAWGPDGALYVVDFGVIKFDDKGMTAQPNTGVIWKVSRTDTATGAVQAGGLYLEWAGDDGTLTVAEWDDGVDARFGEQAIDLAASPWDENGDGIISREEFQEAMQDVELPQTPQ